MLTLCSHNKTVNCKDNAEPCMHQKSSPQTGDLGCHSVTVPLSHTSHRALHPVKIWHSFAERTVCTLYRCVHMCVLYMRPCAWGCIRDRAAHTCGSVHKRHSGNHLLSQSNHILIAAEKDVAACSPTGSELQRVPADLYWTWGPYVCLWLPLCSICILKHAHGLLPGTCVHITLGLHTHTF